MFSKLMLEHDILDNIILATDSYKMTHYSMYPPGINYVYSYFESRLSSQYDATVFFGLQYLMHAFEGPVVTAEKIDIAEQFCREHFGLELFNRAGWEHILHKHGGYLPIEIRAVPEGMVIPKSNALFTIVNTDPKCYWLVNHLETMLVRVWYPCTVATISRSLKQLLNSALFLTGDPNLLLTRLHDFGYRGSTSAESAAIGGAAHLINFIGTDTIAGIELLTKYYGADKMAGISVPASEHSTVTPWTKAGERDAYRHILEQYPTGYVSVVSDSWDIINACRNIWGEHLRSEVRARDGVLVVRPDSGDPIEIVPKCLDILGDAFGFTVNNKGYKVLPDYIRLIQGDGITRHSLRDIVEAIINSKWSLDNIVFGSGGGLLQDCTRDTMAFALKCSWAEINGVGRGVYKQPASDSNKNSRQGRFKLVKHGEQFYTLDADQTTSIDGTDILQTVFYNGKIIKRYTLDEVRQNAALA